MTDLPRAIYALEAVRRSLGALLEHLDSLGAALNAPRPTRRALHCSFLMPHHPHDWSSPLSERSDVMRCPGTTSTQERK